jgi:hypothetical protein
MRPRIEHSGGNIVAYFGDSHNNSTQQYLDRDEAEALKELMQKAGELVDCNDFHRVIAEIDKALVAYDRFRLDAFRREQAPSGGTSPATSLAKAGEES